MKYQGFGPENPVAPNDTEANRAKNRRVEVVLTPAPRIP
jgi:outer membrane protein OmpA-like peptidoglycan-associated protein